MYALKNKFVCISFFFLIFAFSLLCIFLPKADFSESERRVLNEFPEFSAESVFSGSFASGFEDYSTDTFPFRDTFRAIKANASAYLFRQADNNKYFLDNGHLSKLEYPLNTKLLTHATDRFAFIYETYLKSSAKNIYLSIIPDKNYFLDTLKLDYTALFDTVRQNMPYAEYIDITSLLDISDYYTTDSHWRQERIVDVAQALLNAMGRDFDSVFEENTVEAPFFGVYHGQAALNVPPDTIKYLTNDTLSSCIVKKYDSGRAEDAFIYDKEKQSSADPYEMFLSGSSALISVENPKNPDGGHLVIFRDSFASSLIPLLCEEYEKITAIDIRYIPSNMIGSFVSDFDGADVLFLYSASMLNSSGAMK